ncbi:hypothetical protein Pan216_51340 [Planctomycetes bacterium Pan216]|uniref:Uncharacterized protein n=1 Tax=Kolteria novifilia TaxID=2527975 RepID=A0A518BB84_9BACT|nr:hypothetical protein Pan216_51340 [Planctomycetes bacterium Pan216]
MRTFRLSLLVLLLVCSNARPELVAEERDDTSIPKDAQVKRISDTVSLYHWKVPNKNETSYRVYGVPKVTAWPKYKWGAEIMLTPVPFCCGARDRSVQWLKSDPQEPRFLAEVPSGRSYRLFFRFK